MYSQVQYESRSEVDVSLEMLNIREKERFMNGDKDIAIISEAASSGISLQVSIFAVILLENANTIPDWFYRKVWKSRSPVNLKPELSNNYTLIFLDQ